MPLKRAFAGIASATSSAASGQSTITGLVPAGATATAYRNGSALGAATVSALGVASYGLSSALTGGDKFYFAWSLAGQTPLFTVPTAAATVRAATGILGSGDSITRGYGLPNPTTDNWLAQLAGLTGLPFYNDGVDGKKLQAIDSDWATSGNASRYSAASLNTYVQMGGCNDLRGGTLATDLQTYIQSVIGKAKAAGFTTWVCTILPETGYPGWGASAETQRTNYNTWLRNNYASFADGLIDWATASQMQDTSSTVYYQDSLHPTKAGATVLAQFAQQAMGLPSASTTKALTGAISGGGALTGALTSTVAGGALAGAISGSAVLTGALTVAAAGGATVQWNANDKNAAVTKTSATRVDRASTAGGTWASIRCDTSKSSGRRYVEFTANISSSDGLIVGFANATEVLTNYMGQSANSVGVWSSGTVIIGPTTQNTSFGTWAAGDVICLDLDFSAATIRVKRNAGAWSPTMTITNLVANPLFVGATMKSNAELPAVTANFGDSAFVYTPPSGAVAWNA